MNVSTADIVSSLPLWGLALLSIFPLLAKALFRDKEIQPAGIAGFAGISFLFSGLVLWFFSYKDQSLFSNLFLLDKISYTASFVVLFAAVLALPLFAAKKNHVVSARFFPEYIFLFMNSVLGLLLAVWSNHLVSAFIAVEHVSLCFYLMIPLAGDRAVSIEAGLKYFVLGSIAACIFLLGTALVYTGVGALDFQELATAAKNIGAENELFSFGVVFIGIALLFKTAIFPFQFWLPDVYQGSPTPLTAFMAGAVKAAFFILLLKVFFFSGILHDGGGLHFFGLQALAVMTLLVGHISALIQKNLKRMLIYSSIAHAGYMIMALFDIQQFNAAGLIYYLAVYSVTNFGALAFLMFFEKNNIITGVSMEEIKGLYKTHPVYSLVFTWFLLNLAGLPPSAGFFAKWFIFESLIQGGFFWMLFWAIVGSALGLYYYLRPVACLYSESKEKPLFQNNQWIKAGLTFQFILSVVLIFGAGWIYEWMSRA